MKYKQTKQYFFIKDASIKQEGPASFAFNSLIRILMCMVIISCSVAAQSSSVDRSS